MPASSSNSPDPGRGSPAAALPPTDEALVVATRQLFHSHVELRTLRGEGYLTSEAARAVVKNPNEPLQRFLADVAVITERKNVTINYYFGLTQKTAWRPLKFVTQGILDAFEKAALEFYARAHADQKIADFQRRIRRDFRLPDPDLDPDSYWLVGDRFNPRLIILWGCDKLDKNNYPLRSLPLVRDDEFFPEKSETILDKLKKRLATWSDILEENLALAALKQEPLSRFLGRPVFDKNEQLVGLRSIVRTDAILPLARFRPLKKLPSVEVGKFKGAAEAYYARAHEDEETQKANPDVSAYERELRRSFRLPDLDPPVAQSVPDSMHDLDSLLRPGKVAGAGRNPGQKRERAPRISYWTYGKALNRKLLVSVEGNEPQDQCLYLTTDRELDLPPGAKEGVSDVLADDELGPSFSTIANKLFLRRIRWVEVTLKAAACLAVLSALIFAFFAYIYVPLGKGVAEVTDDPRLLDSPDDRNVILVAFPQAINAASIVRAGTMDKIPTFALENDKGTRVDIKDVRLRPGNGRQIVLYLDKADSVPDSADYKLTITGLRPKFGRAMAKKNSLLDVFTLDKRAPEVKLVDAAPDSPRKVWVRFTKDMNADTFDRQHYGINGVTFQSVEKKAPSIAVLVAATDFIISNSYQLSINGIHDGARNNNPLAATNVAFIYRSVPPMFDNVTAKFDQLTIHAVFNQEVDPVAAGSLASYNLFAQPSSTEAPGATPAVSDLGTNRMNIYSATVESPANISVSLLLSNSPMMPGRNYTLAFSGIKNLRGNTGSDTNTFPFAGTVDTQGPELKDVALAGDNQAVTLTFTRRIQGEAMRTAKCFRLRQGFKSSSSSELGDSDLSLIPSQSAEDAVLVKFSAPLQASYRYLLSWSNIQDWADVTGPPGEIPIVPDPITYKLQSSVRSLLDRATGGRDGVEIMIYNQTRLRTSSFDDTNFTVTVGEQEQPLPGMRISSPIVTKPKDLYRTVVKLTWDQELPHDTINVEWKNVAPEAQPPSNLKFRLPYVDSK